MNKIIIFVLLVIIVASLWSPLRSELLQTKLDKPVILVADLIDHYQCGERCIPMQVTEIKTQGSTQYLNAEIHPYGIEDLENYIVTHNRQGDVVFCIKGYLHKYTKGVLRWFVVGAQGYAMEVKQITPITSSEQCDSAEL